MTGIKYALAIGDIAEGYVFTGLWDSAEEAWSEGDRLKKPYAIIEIVAHDRDNLPLTPTELARMKVRRP